MLDWLKRQLPTEESTDAQQIANAKSFVSQDFWPEMLQKMDEMREGALGRLRKSDMDDLANLAYWRAVEDVTTQIARYPESIIEQERHGG